VSYGFSVPFSFPVCFTRDAWNPRNAVVAGAIRRLEPDRSHRVLVTVDEHVMRAMPQLGSSIEAYCRAHASALDLVSAPVVVPGGEAAKNDLAHPFKLLQQISEAGLDRHSCVVVVGGGAALDMVSFAAAIAHRGVRVVRIPTTVLAQADSGIGVKNGINLFGKKNFVGTFAPPFAVVNDALLLRTLPHRERIAGVSEAVKVALLRSPDFYRDIEGRAPAIAAGNLDVLAAVARRSAELHLAHICGNGDPFELGSARPLDFGHWAAHKLESMTRHRLRHGEAVAIGMALDLTYAVLQGLLPRETADNVLDLMDAIGLPLWDDALQEKASDGGLAVLQGLREFREHLGGELHVTLVRDIGLSVEVTTIDETVMRQAVRALAGRRAHRFPLRQLEHTIAQ
jgi:3-dehydroquinate synthase